MGQFIYAKRTSTRFTRVALFGLRTGILGVIVSPALAQAPIGQPHRTPVNSAGPTGSVQGIVLAGDTHRPIRFALVTIQTRGAVTEQERDDIVNISARADATGRFTIPNVPVGNYSVFALAQGYVSDRDNLQAAIRAGADPGQLFSELPVAHVVAGGASSVSLTLNRGAAISGIVHWDDGSPAAGVEMSAIPAGAPVHHLPSPLNQIQFPLAISTRAVTDDRGHYRISGLPPQDYFVQGLVDVNSVSRSHSPAVGEVFRLSLYGPGVARRADAKLLTLIAGQERDDADILFDLGMLWSVSGHIGALTQDAVIATARITLVDSVDPELQISGAMSAQGDFAIRQVPAGTYTLHIEDASAPASGVSPLLLPGPIHYLPFNQQLVITDSDIHELSITLTSAP